MLIFVCPNINIHPACISESGSLSLWRSPWSQKMRCQTRANMSQDTRKLAKKVRNSQRHLRSTRVVQPSLRNTRLFSSIPMLITRKSPFFSTNLFFGLFLLIKVLSILLTHIDILGWRLGIELENKLIENIYIPYLIPISNGFSRSKLFWNVILMEINWTKVPANIITQETLSAVPGTWAHYNVSKMCFFVSIKLFVGSNRIWLQSVSMDVSPHLLAFLKNDTAIFV